MEEDSRAIVVEPDGELEVGVFDVAAEAMLGGTDLMPGWEVGASAERWSLAEDVDLRSGRLKVWFRLW